MTPATLELRFLGEMDVVRDGERLELPPSKKTRALLAYLVLTGRPQRRDRLCQLLWDVADDPRGALRWSLSRLRTVVDEPERPRILAPRDSIGFEAHATWVDVVEVERRCAAGLDDAPLAELTALVKHFRGELLEGLGLDDLLDFQAWCATQREGARKLHAQLLRTIVARLAGDAEGALPYARSLAVVEPLDQSAGANLIRLLGATGRHREAGRHYEAARRLQTELGRPAAPEVEEAWRAAREASSRSSPTGSAGGSDITASLPVPASVVLGLVGRRDERRKLRAVVDEVRRGRQERALLLTGEPGMGKSRLLEYLGLVGRDGRGKVLESRAFEAESGRPFGPWIDLLRQLPVDERGAAFRAELGALLPENRGGTGAPLTRDRLFTSVVELLSEKAASAPSVVVCIDDVHWLDAASAELLHFVARMTPARPLLLALAARPGELFDNEPVQRTLRGLRELRLLDEIALDPLGPGDTRLLVDSVTAGIDAAAVFAQSGGNPLLTLELARSASDPRPDGRGDAVPSTLAELIRHRVERLSPEAGDVLRWSAVLDRSFDVRRLGELMALDLDRLLAALVLLERHALLRVRGTEPDAGAYEFAHEIVRRAVYSELSLPRRRLMHLRIAESLARSEPSEWTAAELAHHASLAGEVELAAAACVRAGRLFLRQFANGEALAVARRGRRHAADVAEPRRTALLNDLTEIELQATEGRPDRFRRNRDD